MKRIGIGIIIALLMTGSFVGVLYVISIATGTISGVDDAIDLVRGKTPARPVESGVDGLEMLALQKSEVVGELARTRRLLEQLQSLADSMGQAPDTDPDGTGNDRLDRAAGWLGGMPPEDAAEAVELIDSGLALQLLTRLPEGRTSEILAAVNDPQRKADLIASLAKGNP